MQRGWLDNGPTKNYTQRLNDQLRHMTNPKLQPFHLAIEVRDLISSREFYGQLFGCSEGRSSDHWIDYDFFGHQLVCHVSDDYPAIKQRTSNPVDGHQVPVPHFGVVLSLEDWESLAMRLLKAKIAFIIEPCVRFAGQVGEQSTMFLLDPSGNALEFKAFKDISQLFAK